jgi:hypothetical protein
MKCPTCNFETEDQSKLTIHMMNCEGEPEEKWDSYIQLEVDRTTQIGTLSEQLEEK